jgi:hypothetical protein
MGEQRVTTAILFLILLQSLMHSGSARNIIINGSDGRREGGVTPGESWAGYEVWKRRLEERSVENIHKANGATNTAGESKEMLQYAQNMHWTSGLIVAWPHQLVRCMGSAIFAMDKKPPLLQIHTVAPPTCDWYKKVKGSQGQNEMSRYEHIFLEYSRILNYVGQGVASIERMFEYYEQKQFVLV